MGRLGMASGWACPTERVFSPGDRLEVCRIDTRAIPTEVVELETFGDRADEELVGDAVRLHLDAMANHELSIARPAARHPLPTVAGPSSLDL